MFDPEFCEKVCPVCTRARRGARWAQALQAVEMFLTRGGCPWGRARQRKYGIGPGDPMPSKDRTDRGLGSADKEV